MGGNGAPGKTMEQLEKSVGVAYGASLRREPFKRSDWLILKGITSTRDHWQVHGLPSLVCGEPHYGQLGGLMDTGVAGSFNPDF
ncbi:hypothetical protein BaRGS_00029813 [Batillaria attramentaria]|uniref:Uncharacterized protein n=1 Tax=Batillaria attramentaria TaxID=370345 RepID=A0ABD0JW89_9CAEN